MLWVKKFFTDKHGHIAILQRPNVFLLVWFFASLLRWQAEGRVADLAGLLASGSIIVWAVLEILDGASYFRRFLGLVVFVFSVYAKLKA